jgi:hypothetical protein
MKQNETSMAFATQNPMHNIKNKNKIILRKLNIDVAQHKIRPTFW